MNKRAAAPPAPTHEWVRCREVGRSAPQAPPGKARAGAVEAAAASGPAPGARENPSPILLYHQGGGRRWNPPPPPPHLDSSLPPTRCSQGPLQPSLPGQNPAWTLLGRSRRVPGALCLSPSRAAHHAGGAETRFEGAPPTWISKALAQDPPPRCQPSAVLGPAWHSTRPGDSSVRLRGSGQPRWPAEPAIRWARLHLGRPPPSLMGPAGSGPWPQRLRVVTAPLAANRWAGVAVAPATWRWFCLVMPRSPDWHGTWPMQVAFHT